jgi:hypothetical protein
MKISKSKHTIIGVDKDNFKALIKTLPKYHIYTTGYSREHFGILTSTRLDWFKPLPTSSIIVIYSQANIYKYVRQVESTVPHIFIYYKGS